MAKIQKVDFFARKVAEHIDGMKNCGMISITDVQNEHDGPAKLRHGWGAVLRLQFDDVDDGKDGQVFCAKDAENVFNWLEKHDDKIDTVFVHCWAGVCRSAAIAKFIAEKYKIPDFNHNYSLYNKLVYRVLVKEWAKKIYGELAEYGL